MQNLVRDKILALTKLEPDDVKVAVMGETGLDIKLSPAARKVFPYGIECKNQEIFTTIYKYYKQAKDNSSDVTPLLVISMNREKPLVILDLDTFMEKI